MDKNVFSISSLRAIETKKIDHELSQKINRIFSLVDRHLSSSDFSFSLDQYKQIIAKTFNELEKVSFEVDDEQLFVKKIMRNILQDEFLIKVVVEFGDTEFLVPTYYDYFILN